MFILCTYARECLSMIKHCTLVLFCCSRLWIPIAKMACLSAEERQSTDWWVLSPCVHICMCVWACPCGVCISVCELVVFLSELISSYPPPIPPQRAVNRVSATRWEMAQLSPAGEIWAGMHHCFFPTECVCDCVCARVVVFSTVQSLWCAFTTRGIVLTYIFIRRHARFTSVIAHAPSHACDYVRRRRACRSGAGCTHGDTQCRMQQF